MDAMGARIRTARTEQSLTQDALAHELEVDVKTVRRWERGVNAPPADVLQRIAALTERPVAWFYGEAVA
jgi:transcriptional regulator with XRE-family HTH domain